MQITLVRKITHWFIKHILMPVFVSHPHELETRGLTIHDATVLRAKKKIFQQSHLFEIMEIGLEIDVFSILPTVNQT